ncbi:MAG: rhodanese-like domain-containing protein [Trueperaceae bacterium]|nr:rhodanese-like domain-containing protein [Trueperaceae bacterium]
MDFTNPSNDRTDARREALPEASQIGPTTALRRIRDEGALLVDVREHAEVDRLAFDVPGAVTVPMSEFERRYAELPRDRELVLACAVGQRSLKATYYLMFQGYGRVANLSGGMAEWSRNGFPAIGEAGAAVAAEAGGCCSPAAVSNVTFEADGCGAPAEAAPESSACFGPSAGSSSCC